MLIWGVALVLLAMFGVIGYTVWESRMVCRICGRSEDLQWQYRLGGYCCGRCVGYLSDEN